MQLDDILIAFLTQGGEAGEKFLERQLRIYKDFEKRGVNISWLLDLSHILFLAENFNVGAKFQINKKTLLDILAKETHFPLQNQKFLVESFEYILEQGSY